jgi:hypothetical protein
VLTVAGSIDPRTGCHPIRIVIVHGDTDALDPYGGPVGPPGYPAIPQVGAAIAEWAGPNGCSTPVTIGCPAHRSHRIPLRRPAHPVHGRGHTWPGDAPVDPRLASPPESTTRPRRLTGCSDFDAPGSPKMVRHPQPKRSGKHRSSYDIPHRNPSFPLMRMTTRITPLSGASGSMAIWNTETRGGKCGGNPV